MDSNQPTPKPLTAKEEDRIRLEAAEWLRPVIQRDACRLLATLDASRAESAALRATVEAEKASHGLTKAEAHQLTVEYNAMLSERDSLRAAVAEAEKRAGFKDAECETVIAEVKRSRDALAAELAEVEKQRDELRADLRDTLADRAPSLMQITDEVETLKKALTKDRDALAALEATGRPWCAMKCGEEEKGWTTAAYVARITDPEMEWAEATTLCLAASAAILAWAEAKGGK